MIDLDGQRIETKWWGPSPAQAPTLVLLHEGLGCIALWRDVPETLAAWTGFGVMAYSRLGYGHSAPRPLPWPASYMHDEAALLPRVLAEMGVERHVLLGHSDGGSIAAIAAGSCPSPGLMGVAMMAAHFFVEDINLAAITAIRETYAQGDLRRRLARYHDHVDSAFDGWSGAWLSAAFRSFDITGQVSEIRVPMLGLQGVDDPYGTEEQLRVLDRHARVRVETRMIDNARHAPHLEARNPTLAAITAFVTDLPVEGFA